MTVRLKSLMSGRRGISLADFIPGVSVCLGVLNTEYYWTLYEGWNFNGGNYLFTTDTK